MKINYPHGSYFALFLFFLLSTNFCHSQITTAEKAELYLSIKGEITFTFQVKKDSDIQRYTENLSIIHYNSVTKTVKAWANEKQFRFFQAKNIAYEVPKSENEVDAISIYDVSKQSRYASRAPLTFPVNTYPTYAEYAQQMQEFENSYPTLVDKFSIGTTTQNDGKEILFVKISDNVGIDEQEPKLMLTSSMHGDEIAGYPMMLSLINYILTVYNDVGHSDHARIKNLVENAEIWINPSANPDGTYYNDATNTSVTNARRANHNSWDLNRNYPDNVAGIHPDGNSIYELETQYFMTLANNNHFVISANFHGGTELVNYPFDNAYATTVSHSEDPGGVGPFYAHPDTNWFEDISVEYATHTQTDANSGSTAGAPYNYKPSYMTDDDDSYYKLSPGVTHGAEWYRVYGGRQDYMNFYQQCRETTIELSDTKILPESQLDDYWYYNRDAILDYLTQGTYGFTGVVKDAGTSNPINATVTIVGHDGYGSHTVTELPQGDYYRPIEAGTYDILFEADCYQSYTLTNQTIANYETKLLADVFLTPIAGSAPVNITPSNVSATTASVSWDNITGATYDYQYRILGSPTWISGSNASNSIALSGLTQSSQYEIQVRSLCNSNTSPYSSSVLFTTTAPPPCTGNLINSFPYNEDFDSGIGDWVQGANDVPGSNYEDWTLKSGGTTSNGTGPNSGYGGSGNYFYTEASNANTTTNVGQNVSITLISPCFDLTNYINPTFSFYYHMFGAGMGSLSVEISTDNGSNWNQLDASGNTVTNTPILNGQQQGSNAASWLQQNIDLNAYSGLFIKLRFTGTTGSTYISDMAIDQLNLSATLNSFTPVADCRDISITLDASGNASITSSSIDNGGSAGNLSIDISSFDCSNIGTNNVTLTATDPTDSGNTDSCVAVVTVNQPAAPTGLECWETATFNNTTCVWDVTGSQPAAPTGLECWETA
ncbi:MAG: hypothetical protein DA407_06090, partial [Bacteroidetes bacterium]